MSLKNLLNKYSVDILGNLEENEQKTITKHIEIRSFHMEESIGSPKPSPYSPNLFSKNTSPKQVNSPNLLDNFENDFIIISGGTKKDSFGSPPTNPETKVKNSPRRKELLKESEQIVNTFISPRKRSQPKIYNEHDISIKMKLKELIKKSEMEFDEFD